jgi:hypothetical protein
MIAIALKCPGCGAGLQISPEMESFACGYCGTSLQTVRQGGTIALTADTFTNIQAGTDRTAAELALVRLKDELMQNAGKSSSSTSTGVLGNGCPFSNRSFQTGEPSISNGVGKFQSATCSVGKREAAPFDTGQRINP